jgi:lysine biosynthesis protein LysW
MTVERTISTEQDGNCPVCDAWIHPGEPVEESEILTCTDCYSMLVVDGIKNRRIILAEAPQMEEDWGQ